MSPVTWQNIAPVNNRGNVLAAIASGRQISEGVAGIGTAIKDYVRDKKERETNEFSKQLMGADTPEQRAAILDKAVNASWVDSTTLTKQNNILNAAQFAAESNERQAKTFKIQEDALAKKENTNALILQIEEAGDDPAKVANLRKEASSNPDMFDSGLIVDYFDKKTKGETEKTRLGIAKENLSIKRQENAREQALVDKLTGVASEATGGKTEAPAKGNIFTQIAAGKQLGPKYESITAGKIMEAANFALADYAEKNPNPPEDSNLSRVKVLNKVFQNAVKEGLDPSSHKDFKDAAATLLDLEPGVTTPSRAKVLDDQQRTQRVNDQKINLTALVDDQEFNSAADVDTLQEEIIKSGEFGDLSKREVAQALQPQKALQYQFDVQDKLRDVAARLYTTAQDAGLKLYSQDDSRLALDGEIDPQAAKEIVSMRDTFKGEIDKINDYVNGQAGWTSAQKKETLAKIMDVTGLNEVRDKLDTLDQKAIEANKAEEKRATDLKKGVVKLNEKNETAFSDTNLKKALGDVYPHKVNRIFQGTKDKFAGNAPPDWIIRKAMMNVLQFDHDALSPNDVELKKGGEGIKDSSVKGIATVPHVMDEVGKLISKYNEDYNDEFFPITPEQYEGLFTNTKKKKKTETTEFEGD